ncbi:hypothetical protein F5B19DRAFT_66349 [Rostrohypoxylon terebratum]|nr:hypothetical protein F5B19DRAFT_66349 [Rostrohypoxylon terebratum]
MMEARSYTQLDRGSVLKTLESRLSTSQGAVEGPQVQLFRVNSPPSTAPPPNFTMPHWGPAEENTHERRSENACTTTPSEALIQSYNKRIQVMQAVINQLRATGKDRQTVEDELKMTREELDKAKTRINDLEYEIEQRDVVAGNKDRYLHEVGGADTRCNGLEYADRGPDHARNDAICFHNVIWGTQPVYDEALSRQLLEYAARGSSFTTTRDFIDYDVRPGDRRTLVVAYSKAPDGPVRWLVVDENHEGEFDLR